MPIESNVDNTRQHTRTCETHAIKHSLSKRLTAPFRRDEGKASTSWKSETISSIWGFDRIAGGSDVKWSNRLDRLETYFADFKVLLREIETLNQQCRRPTKNLLALDPGCCSNSNNSPEPVEEEDAAMAFCEEVKILRSQNRLSEPGHDLAKKSKQDAVAGSTEGAEWHLDEEHFHLLKYIHLILLNSGVPRDMLRSKVFGSLPDRHATGFSRRQNMTTSKDSGKVTNREGAFDQPIPEATTQDHQAISPSTWLEDSDIMFDASIAMATKAIFGISVHDKPYFRDGDAQIKQTNCLWTKEMTLEQLLDREFPKSIPNEQLSGRFKERLVSLRSLVQHADIKIAWTKHFPDHLLLSYNKYNKTLSLFDLPSLIEVTYEASVHYEANNGNNQRVNDYCTHSTKNGNLTFSAEFMLETLQTYHLLIPHRDAKWVRKSFLSSRNPWYPRNPFTKKYPKATDRRIAEVFRLLNQVPGIDNRLTTYSQMFKRFPHWGLRIQSLLEEAEDPTRMSWTGRWAERRKGPRHSFWVTVVGFIAASIFGIVATAFAIVQLWVAWCDWQDGTPPLCKPRSSPGSEPAASMTAVLTGRGAEKSTF